MRKTRESILVYLCERTWSSTDGPWFLVVERSVICIVMTVKWMKDNKYCQKDGDAQNLGVEVTAAISTFAVGITGFDQKDMV